MNISTAVDYDHETGLFKWKYREGLSSQWNGRFSGKPAFTTKNADGYLVSSVNSIKMYAHRAAWECFYGYKPDGHIDHINMDKTDNRISNLRISNKSTNGMNRVAQINNKSGVKGVYYDKSRGKWVAQIGCKGVSYKLGRFDTIEEASESYMKAAIVMHGEFSRV